jgi:hypothetical protein
MTKELNIKIQNYNLISTKVNRSTSIHLNFKGSQLLTHCSLFFVKLNFVAFHVTFPMLQKTFNLVKERRGYGLFCVKGFIFRDKFV